MLGLTRLLADLVPEEPEALALAGLIRFAEARRPARLDGDGAMVPLSEQDPVLWRRPLIEEATAFLHRAAGRGPAGPRLLHALIHATWCTRKSLAEPPPWGAVLALYDALLACRDDVIVRLNRAVALAEVAGPAAALAEVEALDGVALANFEPYHAVRADLLRRLGRGNDACAAYDAALAFGLAPAERRWLERQRATLRA
jgi:RNA polymerase sigma-70 factor (ECF subfamily)